MKNRVTARCLFLLLATAFAAGPAISLRAADSKAPKAPAGQKAAPADKEKRAALRLNVDRKPINRDAADRVSYAGIVKRTAASVVYVYSSQKVKLPADALHNDPTLRRFFEQNPDLALPGGGGTGRDSKKGGRTPPERTRQGLGSGVVISADGYILTNNHVVADADEVRVSIGESNKRYEAKIIGRDPQTDIAVLKIEATGLSPATFSDSEQLQVGDVVLAIGNPFGVGQSVSRGVVSALSRGGLDISLEIEDFIQTDAAINPGNSGGALMDTDGRVVGINTAILSGSGGFNGVGFAIPINLVRFVAEQIVNKGKVERGMLGVRIQDLTEELSSEFGTEKGALVAELTPDSPAEKAGIKAGDVITKVNGAEIRDGRHLTVTISQNSPDSEVAVEYLRDGKPAVATVKLGLRPNTAVAGTEGAAPANDGVLNGVNVGDITPQLRDELKLPARIKGVVITEIDPDSPAARQGLREGDLVLEMNRKPVTNADEAVKLSEQIAGPKVLLLIWRNGRTSYLVIDESKK
jgi:serine protease Do